MTYGYSDGKCIFTLQCVKAFKWKNVFCLKIYVLKFNEILFSNCNFRLERGTEIHCKDILSNVYMYSKKYLWYICTNSKIYLLIRCMYHKYFLEFIHLTFFPCNTFRRNTLIKICNYKQKLVKVSHFVSIKSNKA